MDDTDTPGVDLARFLAAQPEALRKPRVTVERPDFLPLMERWGEAWRVLCAELDIPCPDELVALGDAMADVYIYIRVDDHSYSMLAPVRAREERAFLIEASRTYDPELASRTPMLPVFSEDGDLLLLAKDGRIHALVHDDPSADRVVADSFARLVELARPGSVNPG